MAPEDASNYLFLASAIAGRRISVHVATGTDPLAACDGQSIYVPPAGLRPDRAAWEDVVAQAALVAAGSLDPALVKKLVGRKDAARRYGYLEVMRAAHLLAARLPSAFLELPELQHAEPPTKSAADSLAWAMSRRPLPDAPAWAGCVRPLLILRKAVSEEGLSALTRKQARGDIEQAKLPEFDDEDETEDSKILKLFSNPLAGNNPLSDLLNKLLGAGTSKGQRQNSTDEGGGAEMPVARIERSLRRGVHAMLAKLPVELPDVDVKAEPNATAYPEWDVHAGQYKPRWALVEEVDAWRPDGARDVEHLLQAPSLALRRQLGNLGLDHEMHGHQQEGAELDVGRLLDCAIDLAAGHSPATLDVYRASRRTRRDLAVAIALDISGSTGERDAQGKTVFDRQVQVGFQLARVLHDLGDTVAMFGFHSWGRNLVRAVRLKGPEERWGSHIAARFSQLEPVGYTRTGAAIRHGTRQLHRAMRLPNRLLVLITDGIAYDQDYESAYAEGDARKALEEARAQGTAVVCLCVGGSESAAKLREVFGVANLLVVDEPEQITSRIRAVCRGALASVSKRRLPRSETKA
jgi:nitric oxide reductase activation protein